MDKLKLIEAILGSKDCGEKEFPFQVGDKVFIQCVTNFWTGRIFKLGGNFVTLEDAAWIADTGRFSQAINNGSLSEVEPIDVPVHINLGSVVDVLEWKHALPREQK